MYISHNIQKNWEKKRNVQNSSSYDFLCCTISLYHVILFGTFILFQIYSYKVIS